MKILAIIIRGVWVFTVLAGSLCLQLHAAETPNVVILFTDDQGTLDANCYGSRDLITPNIDRLAAVEIDLGNGK